MVISSHSTELNDPCGHDWDTPLNFNQQTRHIDVITLVCRHDMNCANIWLTVILTHSRDVTPLFLLLILIYESTPLIYESTVDSEQRINSFSMGNSTHDD